MTKIGDGATPQQPTERTYNHQLQENILVFNNAMNSIKFASNEEEKGHLQQIMSQQMSLINSAVQELKRSGIEKQGKTVKDDYERYLKDPNEQNFTALEQDMSTLKEYSQLPETGTKG